jgi:hypothetical protein
VKKAMFSTMILLLCTTWAVAQQSYPDQSKTSSGQSTVQGCLSHSDSGYTITDKSGTTYQITGDTAKLSEHVGHEIQIKGKTAESGATSATGSAAQPSIELTSVKHVSASCGSKGASEKPPMSEKPPK